jgi:hypothetical protein
MRLEYIIPRKVIVPVVPAPAVAVVTTLKPVAAGTAVQVKRQPVRNAIRRWQARRGR